MLNELYRKAGRFKETFLVIIDYDMPKMNGLEVCRKLKSLGFEIKIIMLTGVADQPTVIKAFNDKEIHRYVLKDNEYLNNLNKYIEELHYEYFLDISSPIISALSSGIETAIFDPAYIELFNKTKEKVNGCEFSDLVEESGTMLIVDEEIKNPAWLIIKTESDMDMADELMQNENNVPIAMAKMIQKREKLVFLPPGTKQTMSPLYWILQDAKVLQGKQQYYYSIATGFDDYNLKKNELLSYKDFLYSSD